MRTILLGIALTLAAALPARAQDTHRSLGEDGPRLAELRLTDLPERVAPIRPILRDPVQDPIDIQEDDENATRDSLRNGTLTGLVVGGIIGLLIAAECGHPECGMAVSFAAGIGAAVGVAIDAMFTNRSVLPVDPARPRRAPFDRAVTVGVKKRW